MEKLKSLYDNRDEVFGDKTYEIFETIDNTLSCVTVYLSDIDDIVSQGIIAWEDTSLLDDLIIVIGTVQYNIGDVLELDGEDIEVTLDNIAQFERVVHMSIPYKLVLENNKDNIMNYLYTNGIDDSIDTFSTMNIPIANTEFDLSELSDDQLKSFMQNQITKRDN